MASDTAKPLTIREMAAASGLSEHTLRYYERIGLIKPIPRDGSSGHRRYSADTVQLIEALSCLRATGLPIEEMRRFLLLLESGQAAANEQKALFQAHARELAREMEQLRLRQRYIQGKIAYWEAIEHGDQEEAQRVSQASKAIAAKLR